MRKTLIVLALLASGIVAAKPTGQSGPLLKPVEDQAEAAIWASRFLTRFHYKAVPLDDAMSARMFDAYFESLDGDKLFFLKSDIDRFAAAREQLDDAIFNKDLSMPFAVFNLYLQRVAERTAYSRKLLEKPFDFSAQESYVFDREKAEWPASTTELDDLWRKRVKNDVLRLKLAGKKDDEIRKTLDKRYAGFGDRVSQINGEDVFQTFMNAYATSIEPHTNYLGPRATENFDISMKLSLEGIGAVLQREDEYTAIREIVPGGPAALSGKLKVGDRIRRRRPGRSRCEYNDVIGWRIDDVVATDPRPERHDRASCEVLPRRRRPGRQAPHALSLVRKKVSIGRTGCQAKHDHRGQGRRRDAPRWRDPAADVLSGLRCAPSRRPRLQERHARHREAARPNSSRKKSTAW